MNLKQMTFATMDIAYVHDLDGTQLSLSYVGSSRVLGFLREGAWWIQEAANQEPIEPRGPFPTLDACFAALMMLIR